MSVIMEETSRAGFGPVTGHVKFTPEQLKIAEEEWKAFEERFLNKKQNE